MAADSGKAAFGGLRGLDFGAVLIERNIGGGADFLGFAFDVPQRQQIGFPVCLAFDHRSRRKGIRGVIGKFRLQAVGLHIGHGSRQDSGHLGPGHLALGLELVIFHALHHLKFGQQIDGGAVLAGHVVGVLEGQRNALQGGGGRPQLHSPGCIEGQILAAGRFADLARGNQLAQLAFRHNARFQADGQVLVGPIRFAFHDFFDLGVPFGGNLGNRRAAFHAQPGSEDQGLQVGHLGVGFEGSVLISLDFSFL